MTINYLDLFSGIGVVFMKDEGGWDNAIRTEI